MGPESITLNHSEKQLVGSNYVCNVFVDFEMLNLKCSR